MQDSWTNDRELDYIRALIAVLRTCPQPEIHCTMRKVSYKHFSKSCGQLQAAFWTMRRRLRGQRYHTSSVS